MVETLPELEWKTVQLIVVWLWLKKNNLPMMNLLTLMKFLDISQLKCQKLPN
jgi:hypothetical protein